MSPEQIQGSKTLDGRSDLYAFCVILFQMLTGVTPYQADTPASVMMKHVLDPVPHILTVKSDLPSAFDAIIERGMAKEPDGRFSTTSELASAVELAAKGDTAGVHTLLNATRVSAKLSIPAVEAADATRIASGATRLAEAPSKNAGGGAATVIAPVTSLPPVRRSRAGILVVSGILVALVLIIALVAGGIFLYPRLFAQTSAEPTVPVAVLLPTATADSSVLLTPTSTQPPEPTLAPTSQPSATPTTSEPTETFQPTPTEELQPTFTVPPPVVALGRADKVAFVSANDIWMVNFDGTELVQLTTDGAAKTNLQWSGDGQSVVYVTGKCAKMVLADSGQVEDITCFESAEFFDSFEISPDGSQVAISLDRELYILRYDLEQLRQIRSRNLLKSLATCSDYTPYNEILVKRTRWSADGRYLAVVYAAPIAGRRVDTIRVMDVSQCVDKYPGLDNFPASRFNMSGYNENPIISNFTWNGDILFAVNSFIRNGGFGDLYIYNMEAHKLQTVSTSFQQVNPIDNSCCYRDPVWSPDGSYLLFAFQDIRLGSKGIIQLYYVPFGTVGTGAKYQPIPLPETFFPGRSEAPWPALRPAR
jgi:hypothetical protein